MKLMIRLAAAALILFSIFILSCQKEVTGNNNAANVNKPHSVTVFLTDDQTPVFDSVFIDLQKLEVKL